LLATGIRGLADGTYDFADARTGAPRDVVIVTGSAGTGKTSLLEAIAAAKEAAGSYGPLPDPARLRRHDGAAARLEATWILSDAERAESGLDGAPQTIVWELGKGYTRAASPPALRKMFERYTRGPERGKLEYFPANRRLLSGVRRPASPAVSE